MNISYLVRWQIDDNETSLKNSSVDVNLSNWSGKSPPKSKDFYKKIREAISEEERFIDISQITIVGIFKLN